MVNKKNAPTELSTWRTKKIFLKLNKLSFCDSLMQQKGNSERADNTSKLKQ